MRLLRQKKGKSERWLSVHDDGTVSLVLSLQRLKVRPRRRRGVYTIVSLNETLNLPMECDGLVLKPRLICQLYLRASPAEMEELDWKQLQRMAACKT